jgi:two-component system, chemotaxis family, chemotaxis protein CheY
MAVARSIPILVVEDSQTVERIVRSLLERNQFTNVEYARDAEAALSRLRAKLFSLVISDWNMRPMSGLDLLRQMREHPMCRQARVVLITADQDPALAAQARAGGADAILRKPLAAETLLAAIENAFAGR